MKILVFSDSHCNTDTMIRLVEQLAPQQVFHLGDLGEDAQDLSYIFPTLPVAWVPGNCDGWTAEPLIKLLSLQGRQFLLSHGHLWRVKQGYGAAIAAGHAAGADVLLFGHTHRALCQQLESGMWVLNPGSSRTSFGLIQLDGHALRCSIHPVDDPSAPLPGGDIG